MNLPVGGFSEWLPHDLCHPDKSDPNNWLTFKKVKTRSCKGQKTRKDLMDPTGCMKRVKRKLLGRALIRDTGWITMEIEEKADSSCCSKEEEPEPTQPERCGFVNSKGECAPEPEEKEEASSED